ncbi:MAG TPA: hypothetical protein VFK37_09635 [Bacillales bacterium]|nr:hypothetical protein [Bacillales bacterium]HEU5140565.1 hypothetical protein [Bacillales bacterium]
MKKDHNVEEQLENVKGKYPHSSVTNDTIKTEYEGYPGHLEALTEEEDGLDPVEESVVKHTTEGKTWNTIDKEDRK